METEIKKTNAKKPQFKLLKRLGVGVFTIYLLIWGLSPFIINHFLGQWLLEKHKLELSESSNIRFNPFLFHLSIDDLEVTKNGDKVLNVGALDVEIRLHRLLTKQIFVSEIEIDSLTASLIKTELGVELAGINLDDLGRPDNNLTEEQEEFESASEFEVLIPNLEFRNSGFNIMLEKVKHNFLLSKLALFNLKFSNNQQVFSSDLNGFIDGAEFSYNIQLELNQGTGEIRSRLSLEKFNLSNLAELYQDKNIELSGLVSHQQQSIIQFSENKTNIKVPSFIVDVSNLDFKESQNKLQLESLILELKGLKATLDSDNKLIEFDDLIVDGRALNFKNNRINLVNRGQSIQLQKLAFRYLDNLWGGASLNQISVDIKQSRIESKGIVITQQPILINVDSINMPAINKIKVEKLVVTDFNGELKLISTEKKEPNKLQKVVDTAIANNELEIKPESSNKLNISLGQLDFIKSNGFKFIDETVSPNYQREVLLKEFSIRNLDSSKPDNASVFSINGSSDKYTKFNFTGVIQPFSDLVNLKLEGFLNELSLPPANSYIQDTLGFQIKHGELDVSVDINIENSEISGSTDIKIRGLEMASVESYQESTIQEQTALPLNVALGMLKDSDGNVVLDIPMFGNVDSPSFGMSSFIGLVTKNAIQTAAKNYIIKTFIPYAELLSVTISAGSFILKTRFEDLTYQSGQVEISESQKEYMAQFIKLMKNKKNTQVKICAKSTLDDLKSNDSSPLTEQQKIQRLNQISKLRMDLFKQYVVNAGIESSRILLCLPKANLDKQALPVVSLSI